MAMAIAILGGCARDTTQRFETMGKSATVEQKGDSTRVTVEGLGANSRVIDIKPQEVMSELAIPRYPGSTLVPGSEQCAVDRDSGDRGCRADLRVNARFDDVVTFYKQRLKASPTTISVGGMRTALMVKSEGLSTRSVTVSQRGGTGDVRLLLLRIERAAPSARK